VASVERYEELKLFFFLPANFCNSAFVILLGKLHNPCPLAMLAAAHENIYFVVPFYGLLLTLAVQSISVFLLCLSF